MSDSPRAAEATTASEHAPRWLPIRALAPQHRPRIRAHLLALDEADRLLRFGFAAADPHIEHYVEGLDFERDLLFGVFSRRLVLVAFAHLAFEEPDPESPCPSTSDAANMAAAEFGVSVSRRHRGRGFGTQLFAYAALHARNRGVDRLLVHASRENTAMLALARSAGAQVTFEGAESTAVLHLPPQDLLSHLNQRLAERAAEIDYDVKRQARLLARVARAASSASRRARSPR
ncbi:MAG TPA: GNAT family N-acetyltransferase [Rubrivivax sp.]|nr:GNAT family N-acetyltransferase [Burkholderiales bacterium]HNT39510.1 GNAT family N-acetyltransferase [Rubrivivax sp.]